MIMGLASDAGFGFFQQVLALRGYRQQILSADIANASTPGFKAVDLDFREALAAATGESPAGMPLLVADRRHFTAAAGPMPAAAAAVKYRVDGAVTLDGNSVDLNREKVLAAENAVHYQAATAFVTQMIRMLTTAVGGSAAASQNAG
jgi:flagellar basal-body rod protein FlgB